MFNLIETGSNPSVFIGKPNQARRRVYRTGGKRRFSKVGDVLREHVNFLPAGKRRPADRSFSLLEGDAIRYHMYLDEARATLGTPAFAVPFQRLLALWHKWWRRDVGLATREQIIALYFRHEAKEDEICERRIHARIAKGQAKRKAAGTDKPAATFRRAELRPAHQRQVA